MPSLGKSESFHMQTEEWPRSGTVVSEFFHGHHSLTDEAWVIAGATKESVKEVVAAFVTRVLGKPHVVQGLGTIPVDLGRTGGDESEPTAQQPAEESFLNSYFQRFSVIKYSFFNTLNVECIVTIL